MKETPTVNRRTDCRIGVIITFRLLFLICFSLIGNSLYFTARLPRGFRYTKKLPQKFAVARDERI